MQPDPSARGAAAAAAAAATTTAGHIYQFLFTYLMKKPRNLILTFPQLRYIILFTINRKIPVYLFNDKIAKSNIVLSHRYD
jgi:hypothetical protein